MNARFDELGPFYALAAGIAGIISMVLGVKGWKKA